MVPTARRALIIAAAVLVIAVVVYGSYRVIRRLTRPPEPLAPTGELRVGVDISYAPFGMLQDGEFSGIDVELARALSAQMNIPIRIVPLGYDGLYDALQTDQVDVLISALIPNPTRMDRVRYSAPYFNAGLVLVSPANADINSMEDISGKTLAITLGSSAQTEANRWQRRIPPFTVRPYETNEFALDAARLGEADAALIDHAAARLYLRDHPEWNAEIHEVTVLPYVIATRIERTRLGNEIQNALDALMADGTLAAIFDKYL